MTTAYDFDLILPLQRSSPPRSDNFKKRECKTEIDETSLKISKVCIDDDIDSTTKMNEQKWMHPSKVIAYLYSFMMEHFESKKTFSLRNIVKYKNKNAFLKLWTRHHPKYDDNFVFAIEIRSVRNELLCERSASYTWGGSCFKTHLRFLCLFDIEA